MFTPREWAFIPIKHQTGWPGSIAAAACMAALNPLKSPQHMRAGGGFSKSDGEIQLQILVLEAVLGADPHGQIWRCRGIVGAKNFPIRDPHEGRGEDENIDFRIDTDRRAVRQLNRDNLVAIAVAELTGGVEIVILLEVETRRRGDQEVPSVGKHGAVVANLAGGYRAAPCKGDRRNGQYQRFHGHTNRIRAVWGRTARIPSRMPRQVGVWAARNSSVEYPSANNLITLSNGTTASNLIAADPRRARFHCGSRNETPMCCLRQGQDESQTNDEYWKKYCGRHNWTLVQQRRSTFDCLNQVHYAAGPHGGAV